VISPLSNGSEKTTFEKVRRQSTRGGIFFWYTWELELRMQSDTPLNVSPCRRVATYMRYVTIVLFVAMFVSTHTPATIHYGVAHGDKFVHLCAYLTLSFSMLASWELAKGPLLPINYFVVWLACTIYGAIDEITQIPVGRVCDGVDWLFDVMGVIAGLVLFRILRPLVYRLALLVPATVQPQQ
jgi:VanZ family protein